MVVQGQARVDNSVVQTMIEFNAGAQSQLNFITDLDFSDDITMCLQMVIYIIGKFFVMYFALVTDALKSFSYFRLLHSARC